MPTKKDRQIQDVMTGEKSRGKKSPAAVEGSRRRKQFVRAYERILEENGSDLIAAVKQLELPVEGDALQRLLEVFREGEPSLHLFFKFPDSFFLFGLRHSRHAFESD